MAPNKHSAGCKVFCISLHHLIIGWNYSCTKEGSNFQYQCSQTKIFIFFQDQAPLVLANCLANVVFFNTVFTLIDVPIKLQSAPAHGYCIKTLFHVLYSHYRSKSYQIRNTTWNTINQHLPENNMNSVNWKKKQNFYLRKTPASKPLYSHYAFIKQACDQKQHLTSELVLEHLFCSLLSFIKII